MAMPPIVSSVTTYADGFGRWRAIVEFSRTLSESDLLPEFNLGHQLKNIRTKARAAIVAEIVDREQKAGEARANAEHRIRTSLPNLVVIKQGLDSMNLWHGLTLGEP